MTVLRDGEPAPGATHLVTQEGVMDTLLRLDLDFIKKSLSS
ncbi:hypothetical protein [Streptomyces sp. 2A115]